MLHFFTTRRTPTARNSQIAHLACARVFFFGGGRKEIAVWSQRNEKLQSEANETRKQNLETERFHGTWRLNVAASSKNTYHKLAPNVPGKTNFDMLAPLPQPKKKKKTAGQKLIELKLPVRFGSVPTRFGFD